MDDAEVGFIAAQTYIARFAIRRELVLLLEAEQLFVNSTVRVTSRASMTGNALRMGVEPNGRETAPSGKLIAHTVG